ncbi:hypothetical protein HDU79_008097 [Rhizoclosmatium sp. JEL0117]|nr:hypothetical protein HDU79_008097 [Rhizoclosmatium sp. JEL0117]
MSFGVFGSLAGIGVRPTTATLSLYSGDTDNNDIVNGIATPFVVTSSVLQVNQPSLNFTFCDNIAPLVANTVITFVLTNTGLTNPVVLGFSPGAGAGYLYTRDAGDSQQKKLINSSVAFHFTASVDAAPPCVGPNSAATSFVTFEAVTTTVEGVPVSTEVAPVASQTGVTELYSAPLPMVPTKTFGPRYNTKAFEYTTSTSEPVTVYPALSYTEVVSAPTVSAGLGLERRQSDYSVRCGSDWGSAYSTCGTLCSNDGDCDYGQACFRDLDPSACSQQEDSGVGGGSVAGNPAVRCGTDWWSAYSTCGSYCALDTDCPQGQSCFKDLSVDACTQPVNPSPVVSTRPNGSTGGNPAVRCGADWSSAYSSCGTFCSLDSDCPNGQSCFKDLSTDVCQSPQKPSPIVITVVPTLTSRPSASNPAIRCGSNWAAASSTCGVYCVVDKDCPSGQSCFKDLNPNVCGPVQPSPAPSPPPTGNPSLRCGSNWNSANSACGTYCTNDSDCQGGQTCFKDLSVDVCSNSASGNGGGNSGGGSSGSSGNGGSRPNTVVQAGTPCQAGFYACGEGNTYMMCENSVWTKLAACSDQGFSRCVYICKDGSIGGNCGNDVQALCV